MEEVLRERVDGAEWSDWSIRRREMWMRVHEDPEAYYYEFNPPGQSEVEGDWSERERETFGRNLISRPPNGNWGLFSMHINGRCGKSCKEYFESLESRKIQMNDENRDPEPDSCTKGVPPEIPKPKPTIAGKKPILAGPLRRLLGGSRTPCQNRAPEKKKKNLLLTPISSGVLAVPTFTPPTKDGPQKREYDAWFNNISRKKGEKPVACNPKDWLFEVATCNADHVGPWRGAWETCQLVGVWQDEYHIICMADKMEIYVPQRFVRKKRKKIVRSPGMRKKKRKSDSSVVRTKVPKRRKKKVWDPQQSPPPPPLPSKEVKETKTSAKEAHEEVDVHETKKKKKTTTTKRVVVEKEIIVKKKTQERRRKKVVTTSPVPAESVTTTTSNKTTKNVVSASPLAQLKKKVLRVSEQVPQVERYERCLPPRPIRRVNYEVKPDLPCEQMTNEEISAHTKRQLDILKKRQQNEREMFDRRYSKNSSSSCLSRMSAHLRTERLAHIRSTASFLSSSSNNSETKSREELLREMERRHRMEISSILALSYMQKCHTLGTSVFEKGWIGHM